MLLDFALGIFSAIFLGWMFNFNPGFWYFFAGSLMTILPDSDFVFYFFKRRKDKDKKNDHDHRDFIHYPLIYLPIGSLIFYLLGGEKWAMLFFLCSFLHFLHDSIALGWGIKWLYPFSKNNFAFFYLYSRKERRGLRKLMFSFNKEKLAHYVAEHGDDDWIKNIYYNWHPIAIVEFLIFILSLVVIFLYAART